VAGKPPPQLLLITCAPFVRAQSKAAAIAESGANKSPSLLIEYPKRIGMILQLGQAPSVPIPLFVSAAATPATCVPCASMSRWNSVSMGRGSLSLPTASRGKTILSFRSG
jgi:hypothetical protein